MICLHQCEVKSFLGKTENCMRRNRYYVSGVLSEHCVLRAYSTKNKRCSQCNSSKTKGLKSVVNSSIETNANSLRFPFMVARENQENNKSGKKLLNTLAIKSLKLKWVDVTIS